LSVIKCKLPSEKLAHAAEFFFDQLGLESRSIKILPIPEILPSELLEANEIRDLESGDVIEGWVQPLIRALRYKVYINPAADEVEQILSLAHEMTHIKQYEQDGLEEYLDEEEVLFRGKTYSRNNYWNAPWEVEAREMEEILYDEFEEFYE
jgi:hypothetical protein